MANLENNFKNKNVFINNGFEDEPDITSPKKKRRRRPKLDSEDQGTNVEGISDDTPKKHRRRKRNSITDTKVVPTNNIGIAAYLEDLQDDIEMKASADEIFTINQLTLSKGKIGTFQGLGNTIYIEGSRKFKAENEEKYTTTKLKESQKMSERLSITEYRSENDLMRCAIMTTDRYRTLATFVHGLFSGLILMYTVFSLMASTLIKNPVYFGGIMSLYSVIQPAFFIFNYLMFIFIGVSIMDRCDFAKPSSNCNSNQGGIIVAVVLIIVAFILSNSLYYFSPYFNLFNVNVTYGYMILTIFPTWSVIDAAKSVMVCLAWFVIALLPVYDKYVLTLRNQMKDALPDDPYHDIQ